MPKGIFKNPKERSKKISRALKGIKLSDERRKNMSKAQKIRFQKYSAWNKGLKGAQVAWNKGRKWVERMGENHHNWKKGRIYSEQRYINILKPEHPFCKKSGYVFEHRLVAEKSLGRYLTGIEIIHHINGIRDDNRPENLYLFTKSEHSKYHLIRDKKTGKFLSTDFIENKLKLVSNIIS